MKEIKIVINEDNSELEKRFSELAKAISKKNDNSFLLNEIKDLRSLIHEKENREESQVGQKIRLLDSRLADMLKIVSSRMDDMNRSINRKDDIRDLITSNSEVLKRKIDDSEKKSESKMNKLMGNLDNALTQALASRPTVINNTTFTRGSQVVPYPA